MLKEFKAFALRGNMIDMAVGIIIGGAFGAIVKSLVDDISHAADRHAARRVGFRQLFRRAQAGQDPAALRLARPTPRRPGQ